MACDRLFGFIQGKSFRFIQVPVGFVQQPQSLEQEVGVAVVNHHVEGSGRRFVFKCTPLHRYKRIHGLFARFLLIDRVYDSAHH